MARTPPADFDVRALGGNHWFDNPLLCLFLLILQENAFDKPIRTDQGDKYGRRHRNYAAIPVKSSKWQGQQNCGNRHNGQLSNLNPNVEPD
jgi:hypothetical protein